MSGFFRPTWLLVFAGADLTVMLVLVLVLVLVLLSYVRPPLLYRLI